MIAESKLNNWS